MFTGNIVLMLTVWIDMYKRVRHTNETLVIPDIMKIDLSMLVCPLDSETVQICSNFNRFLFDISFEFATIKLTQPIKAYCLIQLVSLGFNFVDGTSGCLSELLHLFQKNEMKRTEMK